MTTRTTFRKGFTLVEVISVVVILGIAGAIVVPHMLRGGQLGLQAASRMVIADILYAQNEAIANQTVRRVVLDLQNNAYRLTDGAGTTLSASWKAGAGAGQNYAIDFDEIQKFAGVSLASADFGGTNTLEFDALGSAANGGTIDLATNTFRYRITVTPFTGQVTVADVTGE